MNTNIINCITPNWPAPKQVHAYTTTRNGGYSQGSYSSLNIADHVGDRQEAVAKNRALLCRELNLPAQPIWLKQTHSTQAICAQRNVVTRHADASFTYEKGTICVVMTADCLPILLCDRQGKCVVAIHAGWRGLAAGIIQRTLAQLNFATEQLLAWLGPAISADVYEVGEDVRQQLAEKDDLYKQCFSSNRKGHWLFDLYACARICLNQAGVLAIFGGDFCTYQDSQRFFSYRRDGSTGRIASLIWLE